MSKGYLFSATGACTDSPVLVVVCGTTAATYEDSTGVYVLVRFKTDGSIVKTGFSMNYYIGKYCNSLVYRIYHELLRRLVLQRLSIQDLP